ncbi:LysE family translocator [Bordetella trematum]|uniref:LysE family translocator n=1 Tax=Bordetella trematum TaxID=123899 RepID=UPI0015C55201|nr:hypothetical protein [Bordetella trematum]
MSCRYPGSSASIPQRLAPSLPIRRSPLKSAFEPRNAGELRATCAATPAAGGKAPVSDWAALRTGFLSKALNPKTTLSIVSRFMQVIPPGTRLAIQLGYGTFISLAHGLWFTLAALCLSSIVVRARLLAVRDVMDRILGGLPAGLGVLLMRPLR